MGRQKRKGESAIQDEVLIEKAKAGDEHAFRLLIEKYKNLVFKAIYPVLRHEKDAEDAAQEVFLKIYYALPQYSAQGFKAWITRISVNHAIDVKRKKQRQNELILEPDDLPVLSSSEESVVIPLLRKEQRELVKNRLHDMPANYREVIEAYYIAEKSYKQIAIEQQLEVKTVEMKLYRARNWMKKHWKEDDF
ncbi:sigma-70 family RNA polymerase sigma factor [Fredinandcohnia sp. QZ13]|uniref:sigma-70 family RNA polymerase sigma factor n=1 Tax=Fredinandcohnia sp. QZ13 TaxID=3073144 RepID=UPI00285337E4|nr:sigma-70 family RNA polymerase sigma factor [Fredinandcohnia sp. QZ13]MDR4888161.1 sigma-70 family RNA polymerase sigma factor [Fredinandcohnia sp. QZ13]